MASPRNLLLDYSRAGGLDFSLSADKKTGKPHDARRGSELGLDKGVPPSPAFNYLCYRRSALRFCFTAVVCSSVLSVLQGAAANGALDPKPDVAHLPETARNASRFIHNHERPSSPPLPPAPPPPAFPPGSLSIDEYVSATRTRS